MCNKCKRTFKTHPGLQKHQRSCKENQVTQSNLTILSSQSIYLTRDTCGDIWNENKTFIEIKIDSAFNEIVYWKQVLFLLPTEAAGDGFIEQMIKIVNSWTYKSDLTTIDFLEFSKNILEFKIKENSETLKQRLSL